MMKQTDDHEQIQSLQQDWEQLDELGEHWSVTEMEIKSQVKVFQEKQKKKFYKELATFLVTAVFVLSIFIISIVQAPVLFIMIQIGAIFLAPIMFYVLSIKKKQQGKVPL